MTNIKKQFDIIFTNSREEELAKDFRNIFPDPADCSVLGIPNLPRVRIITSNEEVEIWIRLNFPSVEVKKII